VPGGQVVRQGVQPTTLDQSELWPETGAVPVAVPVGDAALKVPELHLQSYGPLPLPPKGEKELMGHDAQVPSPRSYVPAWPPQACASADGASAKASASRSERILGGSPDT
jgi:hypothetical protein